MPNRPSSCAENWKHHNTMPADAAANREVGGVLPGRDSGTGQQVADKTEQSCGQPAADQGGSPVCDQTWLKDVLLAICLLLQMRQCFKCNVQSAQHCPEHLLNYELAASRPLNAGCDCTDGCDHKFAKAEQQLV